MVLSMNTLPKYDIADIVSQISGKMQSADAQSSDGHSFADLLKEAIKSIPESKAEANVAESGRSVPQSPLSEKVMKFKSLLINDQEHRLKEQSIDCEVIDINEIKNIDEKIIGLYPNVGENLDYLNTNNLNLNFLYRKLDQYSWQYCNKGFFNFKNYIPKIIATFS